MKLRQGTPAWLAARRELVTATDIATILGINPYSCEADLADEKRGLRTVEPTIPMRLGTALQPLIGQTYTEQTGRRVKAWPDLAVHPTIEWAGASPDFRVVGERRLVEAKWTSSRARFADGLPEDIQAQVQWQLGVTGYPVADVAALTSDGLAVFEVVANAALFDDFLALAWDFRKRLLFGGTFATSADRIKRDYPRDNGTEMVADTDLDHAVRALVDTRTSRKRLEAAEEALEASIKGRMGEFAVLRGTGWHATWKRTKDTETTDWQTVAAGFLRQLPETEAHALVGLATTARQGFRPFRVVIDKED